MAQSPTALTILHLLHLLVRGQAREQTQRRATVLREGWGHGRTEDEGGGARFPHSSEEKSETRWSTP